MDLKRIKSEIEDKRDSFMAKEEDESDTEALKDVLALPGDLIDTDLVNTIMNEEDDELTKNTDTLESLTGIYCFCNYALVCFVILSLVIVKMCLWPMSLISFFLLCSYFLSFKIFKCFYVCIYSVKHGILKL